MLLLVSCNTEEPPVPPTDLKPTISIDGLSVVEGDQNKNVFVNMLLSKTSTEAVSVTVETQNGTAEAGSDYVSVSTSVEIAPGSLQESVKIEIIGDDEAETSEDFKVSIVNVTGASLGNATATITIENDDAGASGTLTIPSSGFETPSEYGGWDLIWNDEFDGDELDTEFWTYEFGNGDWGWGNNELEYYRRENTSIVDGHLVIEARTEPFGGFNYTSSRLITKDKFEFTYGRVDIRAVLPEGRGIWPALWMLGANISDVGWPRCGEIDIMEIVGHEPNVLHGTVHFQKDDGNKSESTNTKRLPTGQSFKDEFHVFSIIWSEDRIEILLDDNVYHTITRAGLGLQESYPFNDPSFFIFNVAVGGNWPGSPDGSTVFPQHMVVDYIRVFQEK